MSAFGMYPRNTNAVRRWEAERENACARVEQETTFECMRLLLSQHEPIHSLGIDRYKLSILLDFLRHHDTARLERDVNAYVAKGVCRA